MALSLPRDRRSQPRESAFLCHSFILRTPARVRSASLLLMARESFPSERSPIALRGGRKIGGCLQWTTVLEKTFRTSTPEHDQSDSDHGGHIEYLLVRDCPMRVIRTVPRPDQTA